MGTASRVADGQEKADGVRGDLELSVESEPNLLNLILSIGALGQGWTSSKYLVVATTSDGRNFPVHSSDFEEDAKYTRYALERQLADLDGDAAGWAESKGYDQLAEHLRNLKT